MSGASPGSLQLSEIKAATNSHNVMSSLSSIRASASSSSPSSASSSSSGISATSPRSPPPPFSISLQSLHSSYQILHAATTQLLKSWKLARVIETTQRIINFLAKQQQDEETEKAKTPLNNVGAAEREESRFHRQLQPNENKGETDDFDNSNDDTASSSPALGSPDIPSSSSSIPIPEFHLSFLSSLSHISVTSSITLLDYIVEHVYEDLTGQKNRQKAATMSLFAGNEEVDEEDEDGEQDERRRIAIEGLKRVDANGLLEEIRVLLEPIVVGKQQEGQEVDEKNGKSRGIDWLQLHRLRQKLTDSALSTSSSSSISSISTTATSSASISSHTQAKRLAALDVLNHQHSLLVELIDRTITYLGDDPNNVHPNQFFKVLYWFSREFEDSEAKMGYKLPREDRERLRKAQKERGRAQISSNKQEAIDSINNDSNTSEANSGIRGFGIGLVRSLKQMTVVHIPSAFEIEENKRQRKENALLRDAADDDGVDEADEEEIQIEMGNLKQTEKKDENEGPEDDDDDVDTMDLNDFLGVKGETDLQDDDDEDEDDGEPDEKLMLTR